MSDVNYLTWLLGFPLAYQAVELAYIKHRRISGTTSKKNFKRLSRKSDRWGRTALAKASK